MPTTNQPESNNFKVSFTGESFEALHGDGLVFNPCTGTLFVASTLRVPADNELGYDQTWTVEEFTTDGQKIGSFTSDELLSAVDISVLPNGNLLILDTSGGRVVEYTTDGQQVKCGIDVAQNIVVPDIGRITTGLFYNQESGTLFGGNFALPQIVEFDTQGNVLSTLDFTDSLPPGSGFQGVTIDPVTGNFWAVQDFDNIEAPNANTLYEISRSGEIISTTNILELTGYADPEGLSFDPLTRTLYVVTDDDNAAGFVVDEPNRNRVLALKVGNGSVCTPEVKFPCMGDNYDTGANNCWPQDNTFSCGYEAPSWSCDYQYSCA